MISVPPASPELAFVAFDRSEHAMAEAIASQHTRRNRAAVISWDRGSANVPRIAVRLGYQVAEYRQAIIDAMSTYRPRKPHAGRRRHARPPHPRRTGIRCFRHGAPALPQATRQVRRVRARGRDNPSTWRRAADSRPVRVAAGS